MNAISTQLVRATAACLSVLAAGAGLLMPAPANAEPSSHQHTPKGQLSFECRSQSYLRVSGSDATGYRALVVGAEIGGTRYYAGSFGVDVPAEAEYKQGHLVAEIPVRTAFSPSAPTVGLLRVSADLIEGRLQVVADGGVGSGGANQQTVSISRHRALTPNGDVRLTAPDGTQASASGCSGSLFMGSSSVSSDPHASVDTVSQATMDCDPVSIGGFEYILSMSLNTPTEPPLLVLASPEEESPASFFADVGDIDPAAWSRGVSLDLEGVGGWLAATAELRFTAQASRIVPIYSGTYTHRLGITIGRVDGTVAVETGPGLPDVPSVPVSCQAAFIDTHRIAAGGTPSGPVPSNDLPTAALPLAVGTSATAQTAATVPGVEAPVECTTYEDGSSWATNTVWYTITGDGPVTLDTAGSRFDTALAVYTKDAAGALTPVAGACNDDTWTPFGPILEIINLQASLTFDAQPGVTYYGQVGGTDADRNVGTLRVAAEGA